MGLKLAHSRQTYYHNGNLCGSIEAKLQNQLHIQTFHVDVCSMGVLKHNMTCIDL